jgi:hypothetical protein
MGLVVSDKKIFKISANENTLWILAAMLDFKSAPKTQINKTWYYINVYTTIKGYLAVA